MSLQYVAVRWSALLCVATSNAATSHRNTLQRTATHCNTIQLTALADFGVQICSVSRVLDVWLLVFLL